MREFSTGATRSNSGDKPEYEGYLSPAVIRRYGEFMLKHQIQEDGKKRDSDNWQKGIPQESYMDSAVRHLIDAWGMHRGTWKVSRDGDDLQGTLCACMFNVMGYLHEELKKPVTDPARLLKAPIDIIYLDIDGVLADFIGGVMKAFDLEYDYNKWPGALGPDGWNWFESFGLTFDQVDAECTAKFWAGMEWMHDGCDMFNLVNGGPVGAHLLTTPMKNPESTTGKLTWIEKYLNNKWRKNAIVTGAPKKLFARPGALLIDDRDKNVEEFRAAGGEAILVPRPWNKLYPHAGHSARIVRENLKALGLCD